MAKFVDFVGAGDSSDSMRSGKDASLTEHGVAKGVERSELS